MNKQMSQNQDIPQYNNSHYAVVDLGSNSFHLLICKLIPTASGNNLKIINKVKQKVRLASGLDENNNLTAEAINLGIECLKNFALYLNSIPVDNILVVGTAALRIAKNNTVFFDEANKVLPKNIKLLTGEQEAATIYAGVHHAAKSKQLNYNFKRKSDTKQLVIDIGGASTEIIVGIGSTAKKVVSLDIGCVSYLGKYFYDGQLSAPHFEQCIDSAKSIISTVSQDFIALGWQTAVSRSGTMQALLEILTAQQKEAVITLKFLNEIKALLIQCKSIENIQISGLREDRKAVLASGLGILIALFESLNIQSLHPSHGALREGLLFELLPDATIV